MVASSKTRPLAPPEELLLLLLVAPPPEDDEEVAAGVELPVGVCGKNSEPLPQAANTNSAGVRLNPFCNLLSILIPSLLRAVARWRTLASRPIFDSKHPADC